MSGHGKDKHADVNIGSARAETDSLGTVHIEESRYWGAQTQRSLVNFPIGWERMPAEIVHALGLIKFAAADVNQQAGILDAVLANAMRQAAQEVMSGDMDDHFPLSVWQTGSGTHSNMNANEVIANRANEYLGSKRGARVPVHPNDHVNMSQSSNDTFPTAIHIACAQMINQRLQPAAERLLAALQYKAVAWADVVKVGRTHMQDAAPVTLGQVFSGYAAQVSAGVACIKTSLPSIYTIAQGGTATGTGLNTPKAFAESIASRIAELTQLPFVSARNKFALQAAHDGLVQLHGSITTLAMGCFKIANDIRFLASGPRAGLGELTLPANEPGSSIMPGKVNPTQCEALTQVCVTIHGNHTAMCFAGSQGHFELNAFKPMMAYTLLQSVQLLSDALDSFTVRCLLGIEPNYAKINSDLARSLMLVTALVPEIGYDNAATIAKAASTSDRTLREEALASGLVTADAFDRLVVPERMTSPGD